MQSLTIKDLARTTELDRRTMAGVAGGMTKDYKGWMPYSAYALDASKDSFSFDATQLISQDQKTVVNNGNNVAFASGITANVKPTQTADNTINFGR